MSDSCKCRSSPLGELTAPIPLAGSEGTLESGENRGKERKGMGKGKEGKGRKGWKIPKQSTGYGLAYWLTLLLTGRQV